MALQHLRSGTAHKRPIPSAMSAGQIALNTNEASPGLFFKDSNGDLVKVGPVHIGTSAPNSSPDSVAATALVSGTVYQILTVGTTDFTAVGASANTVGTVFTATGAGTGTGTVSGQQGVEKGEQWLDTTGGTYVLKIYDGTAWRSESGTFVDVNGDTMTGALLLDNAASASAPDLSFDGDADTGVYSPGANQVAVSTGGTGRVFIDSSGDVGIGTSSPSQKLTVAGGHVLIDSNNQLRFGTSDAAIIEASGSDGSGGTRYMRFLVNDEKMRIDSSGRLLVGTSSARSNFFNSSDAPKLQLEATSFVGSAASVVRNSNNNASGGFVCGKTRGTSINSNTIVQDDDRLGQVSFQGADGSGLVEAAKIAAAVDGTPGADDMPGRLEFFTTADGASSATERMRIDSSGNVDIGSGSATARLTATNNSGTGAINVADFTASSASQNPLVRIIGRNGANTGTTSVDFYKVYQGGFSIINNDTHSGNFTGFTVGSSERMRIDSSGRVGIGITSPQYPLDVGGNIRFGANTGYALIQYGTDSTATDNWHVGSEGDGTFRFYNGNLGAGTERMRITSSGNVGIGASGPTELLQLDATANPKIRFVDVGNYEYKLGITSNNKFSLLRSDSETQTVTVTSGGRVGIGRDDPQQILHLSSTNTYAALSTSADTGKAGIAFQRTDNNQNRGLIRYDFANDFMSFRAGTTGTGEAMRIDSSGRLLVGASTTPGSVGSAPYALLQIEGNSYSGNGPGSIALRSGTASASIGDDGEVGQIAFAGNDNEEFALIKCDADGATGSGDHPGRLVFSTTADGASSPTERMRIDSSGRMGIGTTSPASELHIENSSGNCGARIVSGTSGVSYLNLGDTADHNIGSIEYNNSVNALKIITNNNERLRIDSSGRLLHGYSSAKTNIQSVVDTFGAPQHQLSGTGQFTAHLSINRFTTTPGGAAYFSLTRSNINTVGGNALVDSGDRLGQINFSGNDGTNYLAAASIVAEVDQTPGTDDMPGRLIFSTTSNSDDAPTERMRIDSDGAITQSMGGGLVTTVFTGDVTDNGSSGTATFDAVFTFADVNNFMIVEVFGYHRAYSGAQEYYRFMASHRTVSNSYNVNMLDDLTSTGSLAQTNATVTLTGRRPRSNTGTSINSTIRIVCRSLVAPTSVTIANS